MKKSKKKILCILVLTVLLVSNFGIGASAATADIAPNEESTIQEQDIPDALNPVKEKAKLNEYMIQNSSSINKNSNEDAIKLSPNEPIILTFDDGSRIEYRLEVEESANLLTSIVPFSSKTYVVTKTYFYGIGNVSVKLHAECTHDGRRVTINRTYDSFLATLARVVSHNTAIIKATGFNSTDAIAEGWGELAFEVTKVGQWLYRSYRIQILIDPTGIASIRVLD